MYRFGIKASRADKDCVGAMIVTIYVKECRTSNLAKWVPGKKKLLMGKIYLKTLLWYNNEEEEGEGGGAGGAGGGARGGGG